MSTRGLRALKALVIAMGVAIVGGFAVIIVVMVDRATDRAPANDGPFEFDLALAPGAVIEDIRLDGSRALIRAALPDGAQILYLIDMNTGETSSVARVSPGDAGDASEAP